MYCYFVGYQHETLTGTRRRTLVRRTMQRLQGADAIHHYYSNRRVLIFCQIRDFQSYSTNNKSNKSI
jgi:hypothetical protein